MSGGDASACQFRAGQAGACPWCRTHVRFLAVQQTHNRQPADLIVDQRSELAAPCRLRIHAAACPSCGSVVMSLAEYVSDESGERETVRLVYPRSVTRPPVPPEVPSHIRADYLEAASVLADSPKASAALSRRCLQAILRETAGAASSDLSGQIAEVLRSLPGYIAEDLDAVRSIGNFAAHPTKSRNTGILVDVEPAEAEWNLKVLDLLFDYYYVQPVRKLARRDALNRRLQEAGKPPIRQPAESSPGESN